MRNELIWCIIDVIGSVACTFTFLFYSTKGVYSKIFNYCAGSSALSIFWIRSFMIMCGIYKVSEYDHIGKVAIAIITIVSSLLFIMTRIYIDRVTR